MNVHRPALLPNSNTVAKAVFPLMQGVKFAVVWCGNHQYKVTAGDVIAVQQIRAEIGCKITLKKVALVGGAQFTAIGRPLLEQCRVVADVEEHKKMRNVIHLSAPYGWRMTRWKDNQHAATILRIKGIYYLPDVVGEVDKYTGILQDPKDFDPKVSPNATYWSGDVPTEFGNAYPLHPEPMHANAK